MNKEQLQQKIAFYFEKLPPSAQAVFSQMEWLQKIQDLGSTYALSPEQIETLATETTLILLGIIEGAEYANTLSQELHLPKLTLDKILTEINNSILNPIQNELTQAFEANIAENTPAAAVLETKLDERFSQLPKDIQDSISNSNYYASLYEIVTENNLTIPQMGALEECLTDAMLGKIKTNELKGAIVSRLGITEEVAGKLIKEINEKISKELREKLMSEAMPRITAVKDSKILESAGIQIIGEEVPKAPTPVAPTINTPKVLVPTTVATKADLSRPVLPAPVLSQKFTGSFKMDTVKTDITPPPALTKKVENESKAYPKGVDPYREVPK
jgi:hypothetical protein